MAHFTLIGIFSIALQALMSGLSIWAGVLIFRTRGMAGWMALVGSILATVATTLAVVWPFLSTTVLGAVGSEEWMFVYQGLYLIGGVSELTFLAGLLLYLLKQRSHADRIEQLEAIIRDRDQVP
jgi:hypothetical protein